MRNNLNLTAQWGGTKSGIMQIKKQNNFSKCEIIIIIAAATTWSHKYGGSVRDKKKM